MYYYTVFSNSAHGLWERQMRAKVEPDDQFRVEREECDFEQGSPRTVTSTREMTSKGVAGEHAGKRGPGDGVIRAPAWGYKLHRIPTDV